MLDLYFFNVGHGDSIAINFPNDEWGIVDCNRNEGEHYPQVLKFLKINNISHLNFVCITHPHLDHFKGLDSIINYYQKKIGKLIIYGITRNDHEVGKSDLAKGIKRFAELYKSKEQLKKHLILAERGNDINVGDVKIKCLNPTKEILVNLALSKVLARNVEYNDVSVVLCLEYKGKKILLNGDSTINNWLEIFEEYNDLKSDIIKISHHGSKNNNNLKVLRKIINNKAITIISTDGGIKYKNIPAKEVINNLKTKFKSEVIRTDELKKIKNNNELKIENEIEELLLDTLCEDKELERIIYDGYIKVSINEQGIIKIEKVNNIE